MASEQWKKDDIAYAMSPFKLFLWPIGVWPLQVYDVYSLVRCILATCCMSGAVILPSIELQMGCTDAERNIDCLMLICCGVLAMLKMIWFRIYAHNLTVNYDSALNDYLAIENAEQRIIMRRHAYIGRTLLYSMVGFAYIDCLIFVLIPFLVNNPNNFINVTTEDIIIEYTIPSRCALGYFRVPTSMYRIFCLIEFVMIILVSTSNYGNDALFLNITLHICGQVKILNAKFINFDIASPRSYERFNSLIQKHDHLMRMSKKLADVVSFILLTQFFLSSVLLCIIGFQFILALKVNNTVMMTKSFMVLGIFLVQLSIHSFVGDYFISQMEEVGHSIYHSIWYGFPTKLMRNLIFIIMRSQSPVKLQAGNFIVVNLATFMSILKTSMSYLSVLRVIVET